MCKISAAPMETPRVTQSFDAGWQFLKADANGAEQNNFDDSTWRKLDVPLHDIGRITREPGLRWLDAGGRTLAVELRGYNHFP